MQPKLRVIPGRHHDPAEEWHRPPKLRAVMELGPRPMSRRQAGRMKRDAVFYVLGVLSGVMLVDAMVRWGLS